MVMQPKLRQLVLSYYSIMFVLSVTFYFFAPRDGSLNGVISSLLLLFIITFPIIFIYTTRYALHIFLFLLAFITGFYGFYHLSIDHHSISNALYFTFRLYLLDFADVFTQDGMSPEHYPVLLEIARWSAAAYTITTIFIAMYRSLEQRILLFFAQFIGGHHVVFSFNEKSRELICDLRENHARVIVVDNAFSDELRDELLAMKVIIVQATTMDHTLFRKCGVRKAKSISLFHLKDRESLRVLMRLETYAQASRMSFRTKKVLIHVEASRFKYELQSFLKGVEHFSFPVQIMNVYETIAKKFWQDHTSQFKQFDQLNLLVVGYNALGKEIIEQVNRFSEKNKIQTAVTVLDVAETKIDHPQVKLLPFDVNHDEISQLIADKQADYTHIFVCLDEDYVDLMEGIELSDMLPTTPVYMSFTDESIAQMFTVVTTETEKTLESLGTMHDVLRQDYLKL